MSVLRSSGVDRRSSAIRRQRETQPPGFRCGPQRLHFELVNPFLRGINKLEERAMFHMPQSMHGKREQQRRMMQMVGVSDRDWPAVSSVEEVMRMMAGQPHRNAATPFAFDKDFTETPTGIDGRSTEIMPIFRRLLEGNSAPSPRKSRQYRLAGISPKQHKQL